MNKINLTVTEDEALRIDSFIVKNLEDFSRTKVKNLIGKGDILVNGLETKANYKVKLEDEIEITIQDAVETDILKQDLNLEIIYEDDDVCVVNKPINMVVHPSIGHSSNTLVNGLMYQIKNLSGINGELRPGIVHRIDKDTSGLLMVAKNDVTHVDLVNQLMAKTVKRKYIAIVHGIIPHNLGKINAPIGRNKTNRKLMDVVEGGKEAVTHFKVLDRFKDKTLIECVLETGRTHQIRVHMKYIGYQLVGDPQYGRKKDDFKHGQYLHAKLLGFVHPVTKKELIFEKELPDFFKHKIEKLKEENL